MPTPNRFPRQHKVHINLATSLFVPSCQRQIRFHDSTKYILTCLPVCSCHHANARFPRQHKQIWDKANYLLDSFPISLCDLVKANMLQNCLGPSRTSDYSFANSILKKKMLPLVTVGYKMIKIPSGSTRYRWIFLHCMLC